MRIGIPTEIKTDEARVALAPAGARELVAAGHEVVVQAGAGRGSAIDDDAYVAQGAQLLPDAAAVFATAEMIVKVKEPQPGEIAMLTPAHTLFTYLHLAADRAQAEGLIASGATCIAYETVSSPDGRLPLLAPMSEVAGRIATQAGAFILQRPEGGRGVLIGGAPGVKPANVVVIGGGVVGTNAARVAVGMGAETTIFDTSISRLRELEHELPGARTRFSSSLALEEALPTCDLLIGAVLVPGARAPRLVTREMLRLLPPGAVLVDVAIDQGGCFETSRPTTHSEPTFVVGEAVHYCVANMPGAVPITSTHALTNATLPYVLALAGLGPAEAIRRDPGLREGLNVAGGRLVNETVAAATGLPHGAAEQALAGVGG
jgi:alanine dehydrogenase